MSPKPASRPYEKPCPRRTSTIKLASNPIRADWSSMPPNPAENPNGPATTVASPRRRRWFTLSVRALMIFVLVIGGGLGWVVHRARVQRNAVTAIERAGGRVYYDWQSSPSGRSNPKARHWIPQWFVDYLGRDYFGSVRQASLGRQS